MQEKFKNAISLKQAKNSTLFGEIHTSTTTFIACLTYFHLIWHPFKIPLNSHRPMGIHQSSYPYQWEFSWESPYPRQPL